MSRIAYVNGRWLPISSATVKIEDRGLQFSDGVYEVIKVIDGRLCDFDRHFTRLDRSLSALSIPAPASRGALTAILAQTLRRNRLRAAALYVQVNRGVAPRNHSWRDGLRPSLIVSARPARFPTPQEVEEGVSVITLPDRRWAGCHIKSVSLLPNVLAKQQATQSGSREAWLLDPDGFVTEGSSSNAYIVDGRARIITHPLTPAILGGVTREVVLELARRDGIEVVERPFSIDEARDAREAFLTSTTSLVLAVTSIDGRPVANGRPGTTCRRLAELYASASALSADQGRRAPL